MHIMASTQVFYDRTLGYVWLSSCKKIGRYWNFNFANRQRTTSTIQMGQPVVLLALMMFSAW